MKRLATLDKEVQPSEPTRLCLRIFVQAPTIEAMQTLSEDPEQVVMLSPLCSVRKSLEDERASKSALRRLLTPYQRCRPIIICKAGLEFLDVQPRGD